MQTAVIDLECDDCEYPFLGKHHDLVVLFSACGVGTVVSNEGHGGPEVGFHNDDWDMDLFEPFDSVVVLANDGVDLGDEDCDDEA